MPDLLLQPFAAALLSSLLAAGAGLYLLNHGTRLRRRADAKAEVMDAVFLLGEGDFLDMTESAERILDAAPAELDAWSRLHRALSPGFPDFPDEHPPLTASEGVLYTSGVRGRRSNLQVEKIGHMIRVVLTSQPLQADPQHREEMEHLGEALATTTERLDHVPHPVWVTDAAGTAVWKNRAFLQVEKRLPAESKGKTHHNPLEDAEVSADPLKPRRMLVQTGPHGDPQWFDVYSHACGGGRTFYAVDVNAVVQAQSVQRNFVQTLAKTFAQLSIGLVIFDRNRQLVMFNPSLIELTGLSSQFLSSRPTVMAFFDKLRERQTMPEPKNYSNWRSKMTKLLEEAADGTFSELWTLPSGLTYRVNGRPHPDGAIAFLFEDISAEISLTRQFRAELDTGQSVMDAMDCALAVFSASGNMTMCNAPYRRMWRIDPDRTFSEITVQDCLRHWSEACAEPSECEAVADILHGSTDRTEQWKRIRLTSGRTLHLQTTPLAGGQWMVAFHTTPRPEEELPQPSSNVQHMDA